MKKLVYIISFLIILLLGGCDNTSEPNIEIPALEKSIKGTVKDAQGNLLSDVRVYIFYYLESVSGNKPYNRGFINATNLCSVTLDTFLVEYTTSGIYLYWRTSDEVNNSGFVVERSYNNAAFDSIGFIQSQHSIYNPKEYGLKDNQIPNGLVKYRLKIVSNNGTFNYSPVVEINVVHPSITTLEQNFPNPTDGLTTFKYSIRKLSKVDFSIYNFKDSLITQIILIDSLWPGSYQFTFNLSRILPSNGYKFVMDATEMDGTNFKVERNFIWANQIVDDNLSRRVHNKYITGGKFEFKFSDLPLGQQYVWTSENDPSPIGTLVVTNKIKLVFYKQGFRIAEKEITIDPNQGQMLDIQLQP